MALIYQVDSVTQTGNSSNFNVNLTPPAADQNSAGNGIDVDFQYVASGDANGDGNMDVGDTFEVTFDGGVTFYTATVTHYYVPNASSDSDLLVFFVDDGGVLTSYALNMGTTAVEGETDPYKVFGGRITQGHANQGSIV